MVPEWIRSVDRSLFAATRAIRLLGAVTPTNADRERARMVRAFEAGGEARPRWEYAADACDAAAEPLERARAAAEHAVEHEEHDDLAALYLARAEELALEARIAAAAGTTELALLAAERFSPRDARSPAAAADLARAWLAEPAPPQRAPTLRSDDDDPRSLLSRMRAEVSRRKIPFAVHVHAGLAPLAATGERSILVAAGREVTADDIARTVLHEVSGHAMPRVRAKQQRIGLFAIATARGAEEQEGYALLLESRAELLGPSRRKQLAARHVAGASMLDGATFVEAVRTLIDTHGIAAADAVIATERVFRGSDGIRPGLGRERVYLESYVRVTRALEEEPEDEAVLENGQVAIEAVDVMRRWMAAT